MAKQKAIFYYQPHNNDRIFVANYTTKELVCGAHAFDAAPLPQIKTFEFETQFQVPGDPNPKVRNTYTDE